MRADIEDDRQLTDRLATCLERLRDGATVEACLARFPEDAEELRPLLELAVEMEQMQPPLPSTAAKAEGKRRMLRALAERGACRADERAPSPYIERFRLWVSRRVRAASNLLWSLGEPGTGLRPAVALTAVVVLLVVGGILVHAWLDVSVPRGQSCARAAGGVEVRYPGDGAWQLAPSGRWLGPGAEVRTAGDGGATLVFFDGSETVLDGDTELLLEQMAARRGGGKRVIVIHQRRGRTDHVVQPLREVASRFEVKTGTAVARVRGTEFSVSVQVDGTTQVVVWRGEVEVVADESSLALLPGWSTTVAPNLPPSAPVIVPTPETRTFPPIPSQEPAAAAQMPAGPSATSGAQGESSDLSENHVSPSATASTTSSMTPMRGEDDDGGGGRRMTASPTLLLPTATATRTPTPRPTVTPTRRPDVPPTEAPTEEVRPPDEGTDTPEPTATRQSEVPPTEAPTEEVSPPGEGTDTPEPMGTPTESSEIPPTEAPTPVSPPGEE